MTAAAAAKVLVVEDNPVTRKMVRLALQSEGYAVLEAEDGRSALASVADGAPDVVLQDLKLPDMDGIELVRKLRATPRGSNIPIIAFSGFLSRMEQARSERVGFTDFIFKPVNPSKLVETLHPYLRPRSDRKSRFKGRNVLLVDDDPVQLKVVRLQLEALGFKVATARDGEEALARARELPPQAIVSDVLMPHMDGFRLCQAVRREPPLSAVPIVLVSSAYVEEEDRVLAKRAGANAFVLRSPAGTDLSDTLIDALNGELPTPKAEEAELPTSEYVARALRQLERQTHLNRRMGQRVALLEAQLAIGAGLSALSLDAQALKSVAEESLHSCFDAAGVSVGAVYLTTPIGVPVVEAHLGFPDSAGDSVASCFGQADLFRKVIETQEPLRIPSHPVPWDVTQALVSQTGARSLLLLPLSAGKMRLGLLLVGSNGRDLGEDWVDFLRICANHIAQCIELAVMLGERERTAIELRESEARFRQIAECINEVFYLTDAKTQEVLYVSPACERIWGQTQAQIMSRPEAWMEPIVPEDLERITKAFISIPEEGKFDETFRIRHPDGTLRWARSRSYPVKDKEGRVYRYTGIASDITDLKAAQEALTEKAALSALAGEIGSVLTHGSALREILGGCTDAIVRHLGAAFARIWTLNARDDVLELQASSGLYTHLDGPHCRVPVGMYKIGLIARERLPHLTNDVLNDPRVGDQEWARRESMVAFAGYPLMVQDELLGVMAMFSRTPLTAMALEGLRTVATSIALGVKRKLAEEAQAGLEGQLRQAQKMEAVGRLAGGVAHDFNNLLTAILGYGHLLAGRLGERDPGREDIDEILKAGERAAALTKQLLAFSRKQVLQPKILDLNTLAAEMEQMLRRLIGEDIQLATSLDEDLGKIKADPAQVEQVIMNLAVNARDAMPAGGKLTIQTTNVTVDDAYVGKHLGAKAGRYVMLAVADTGMGMDAATQARIFEPFFTTKEAGKGTGLGLATVYGIVKQSDGYISVYSEPGHGTVFKILFPCVDAPPAAAKAGAEAQVPRGTETVLLIEDEPAVRRLARLVLEAQGYTVIEAPTCSSALEAAREYPTEIHLILTDVVMPEMNGHELSRRLAEIRPAARVLFMSGYTGETIVRHGVLEEGIAFLQKPFMPADLAVKVRQVLDGAPPGSGSRGHTPSGSSRVSPERIAD